MSPDLHWYLQRARRMSPTEVVSRAADQSRRVAWRKRQLRTMPERLTIDVVAGPLGPPQPLPADLVIPADIVTPLVRHAEDVLAGRWRVLGVARIDSAAPEWFLDPVTGRRAPDRRYAFDIDHRSEQQTGNVKQVWEISRHHHLTLLAAAWFCTGDERYAEAVDRQLRSWWAANPLLSGINWTSGIELGIRLISWVWIRRLLDGWPGAPALFELNHHAVAQVYWHQSYLAAFRSRGSSANNHVVAETAGHLAAACAFPWFKESGAWAAVSAERFAGELSNNTFPSGVNRELASDYHGFVAELGLVAAVEAAAAGRSLPDGTWRTLCAQVDAACALMDETGRPPRQGDGDDGRALVLDDADRGSWPEVVSIGAALFGPLDWWPPAPPTLAAVLLRALAGGKRAHAGTRPAAAPNHFADAGVTILRTVDRPGEEIWCRCDGGPHGYLSIAAHAHADALSIEVRHGGVDVLSDPGTYCYHGEPEYRSYFRSTRAHNTLELDNRDQSVSGGPFMWLQHAESRVLEVPGDRAPQVQTWSAEHTGYTGLRPPAIHRRTVRLSRRALEVEDRVRTAAPHSCQLLFHLGPSVTCRLNGSSAELEWQASARRHTACFGLPAELQWSLHHGEARPPLGWYSPRFGIRVPSSTLVGRGTIHTKLLRTKLVFNA